VSDWSRGQLNNEINIVGLHLCLVGGAVSDDGATLFATVSDDVSAAQVGLGAYGAKNTSAGILSVAGENIHVKRGKAKGTMVARGVAEG